MSHIYYLMLTHGLCHILLWILVLSQYMIGQTSQSMFSSLANSCLPVYALSGLLFIVFFLFSTGMNSVDVFYP